MIDEDYSLQQSFQRSNTPFYVDFEDFFACNQHGNGQVVTNNSRTGAAQGKSNLVRKAHCRVCDFPNDLSVVDHSGGSLDGEGAGGSVVPTTATYTLLSGVVATETYGTQAYRVNAGCYLCFSKNNSKVTTLVTDSDPWSTPRQLGF